MEGIMFSVWVGALTVTFGSFLFAADTLSSTGPAVKDRNSSPISFCGKVIWPKELEKALLSRKDFHPFPTLGERKEWDSLPAELRHNLIQQGEIYSDFQWPNLPVVGYLDYNRDGNRGRFETIYFARRYALTSLVIAECVENKGRFLDQILNGVWAVCEETSWVLPAHTFMQKDDKSLPDVKEPVIDLFAGETGSMLACISYLMESRFEKISPLVNERIRNEVKRRILDPYLERDDFWWFGYGGKTNNWNPWCNSNCLVAFLLTEENRNRR